MSARPKINESADDTKTETIRIHCTWRSSHLVEVPKDWVMPSRLSEFPHDVLAEIDSSTAELVDWE